MWIVLAVKDRATNQTNTHTPSCVGEAPSASFFLLVVRWSSSCAKVSRDIWRCIFWPVPGKILPGTGQKMHRQISRETLAQDEDQRTTNKKNEAEGASPTQLGV